MGSINLVVVLGQLGADPELSQAGGQALCRLRVATTEWYKGKPAPPEWHRVTVWGEQADACARYLKKGSSVCVEGRIKTEQWTKDGERLFAVGIVARRVTFLDSKKGAPETEDRSMSAPAADGDFPGNDDDPF